MSVNFYEFERGGVYCLRSIDKLPADLCCVFKYLLSKAAYKQRVDKHTGLLLEVGEMVMSISFMVQHFKPLRLTKGRINRILERLENGKHIDLKQETNKKHGTRISICDYSKITRIAKSKQETNRKQTGNKCSENRNNISNNRIKNNKEVEEGGSKAATTTLEQMRIIARSGNGSRQYKKETKDQEIVSKLLMDTSERKLIKAWNQFVSDPSVSRWHTHRPITVALFETWLPDYQSVYERFE